MLPVNYGMKIINLQLNKNFVLHETALEMKVQSVIYTKDYLNIRNKRKIEFQGYEAKVDG